MEMKGLTIDEQYEILKRGREVEPVAHINGVAVYDNQGAQHAIQAQILAAEKGHGGANFDEMEVTPDGNTYRSTKKKFKIANLDAQYANRYCTGRVKRPEGTVKEYRVVTDFRAIIEQPSGRCYSENILVYLIGAYKTEDGGVELKFHGTKSISSPDFVRDYRQTLDHEAMAKVLNCINAQADTGLTKDSISV